MARGLLLYFLWLMVYTQARIINELRDFNQHEVVFPQKQHVMQKIHLQEDTTEPHEKETLLTSPKYIRLFLVLDKAFCDMHKGNQTQMRDFLFNVVNLLNVIYNTIDVHVALVGMEMWSDTNKINVVPNIQTTFTEFSNWHRRLKERKHDHAQLLSGITFDKKQVGSAASYSMCNPNSIAVIEAWRKNSVSLVGLMSHELGHVLGMPDVSYKTKCPSGSCVMNQYLTSKFPKDFSENSLRHFRKYLLAQKPMCLLHAPAPEHIITNPTCGNKLREVGEDCDCGTTKECANPCCDAETCKWKPGAHCEGATATPAE